MGDLFGGKSAKRQAAATIKAAEDQARADRLSAQASQQMRETTIAQSQAADQARDLLDVPMANVEVDLAFQQEQEYDEGTGRRRTRRANFMASPTGGAGIQI